MFKEKGKNIMTQEEHDDFMKNSGISEEEHERWHKEHDGDEKYWAEKSKNDTPPRSNIGTVSLFSRRKKSSHPCSKECGITFGNKSKKINKKS